LSLGLPVFRVPKASPDPSNEQDGYIGEGECRSSESVLKPSLKAVPYGCFRLRLGAEDSVPNTFVKTRGQTGMLLGGAEQFA